MDKLNKLKQILKLQEAKNRDYCTLVEVVYIKDNFVDMFKIKIKLDLDDLDKYSICVNDRGNLRIKDYYTFLSQLFVGFQIKDNTEQREGSVDYFVYNDEIEFPIEIKHNLDGLRKRQFEWLMKNGGFVFFIKDVFNHNNNNCLINLDE